jgi:hypothetical protein
VSLAARMHGDEGAAREKARFTGLPLETLSRERTGPRGMYNRAQRGDGAGGASMKLNGESQILFS